MPTKYGTYLTDSGQPENNDWYQRRCTPHYPGTQLPDYVTNTAALISKERAQKVHNFCLDKMEVVGFVCIYNFGRRADPHELGMAESPRDYEHASWRAPFVVCLHSVD